MTIQKSDGTEKMMPEKASVLEKRGLNRRRLDRSKISRASAIEAKAEEEEKRESAYTGFM